MKKRICYILIVSVCAQALCGCSLAGSVYENYRELEQLRLVEVMGLDADENGTVLSIAAGPGVGESSAPVLMHARGSSITGAVSALQDYAASEDLYYAHTQYLIIGGDTAETGLAHYLDYIDRSPTMRMGISMYVVRGGTAQELIEGSGGESYDVSNVLASLERDAEKRGEIYVTTCRDIVRGLSRSGAALAAALEICSMEGISSEAEGGGLAAIPAGYCVLRGDRAVGWLSGECAEAVGMLKNRAAALPLALPDGQGGETTVTLTGCSCSIEPVWTDAGSVCFDIELSLKGAIVELDDPLTLLGSGAPEELARRMEALVLDRAQEALRCSQELGADFLGLGVIAQRAEPRLFAALEGGWETALRQAEARITVRAEVERSYDLTVPVRTGGEAAG